MLRKRFTPRDQTLIVRLTVKEKKNIQATAAREGITTSECIRLIAERPPSRRWDDARKAFIECKYLAVCKFGHHDQAKP